MNQMESEEKEKYLLQVEAQFKAVLSPAEPWIMLIQSLLVWEKPKRSAVLFVCVHVLFWFFTCSGCRFYSTASTIAIVIYFLYTWKRKIWPEIRVPPKEPEDKDGWTPVHPRLLSVPELCKHLARGWCCTADLLNSWIKLRRTKPFKFCIMNCVIFGLLALLGQYISDIMLSYIIRADVGNTWWRKLEYLEKTTDLGWVTTTLPHDNIRNPTWVASEVISILLWPCVQYHSLLKKLYLKCEPIFMKLDYSMKNKSKWYYQTVSGSLTTANNNSDEIPGETIRTVVTDSEIDLEEFMPPDDPQISAALARAITDSEDEGMSLTPSTTPLTFSKEPSITGDDDNQPDLEDEFVRGIDAMPSFTDVLDHTDDEILSPDPTSQSKSRESSEEPIRFDPGHFDQSSGSEDDLTLGSDEKLHTTLSDPVETQETESLTEALMATALKQMVGSALQNLTGMTKQTRIKARPKRARIAYTHGDNENVTFDTVDAADDDGTQARSKPRTKSEDSEEINIEEEFEFLDQYDLDPDEEKE